MVLILDGNAEQVAQVWRQTDVFYSKFDAAAGQNKIGSNHPFHSSAQADQNSILPSNINTMLLILNSNGF